MRIDEILSEEGFNFQQALQDHRDNLHDSGAAPAKIQYIIAYITRGQTQIKSAADFNTWANSAQDAYDAKVQQSRDAGQDSKIDSRSTDVRSDGSKKRASNQYVNRGSWAQKGSSKVKTGIKPIDTGADMGADLASRLAGGTTAKSK